MSGEYYAIFMKMLEIIEIDVQQQYRVPTEEEQQKITNMINIIGDKVSLDQTQTIRKEKKMNIGDKFEKISNSIIATRGSIARGVIGIQNKGESDVADAIENLAKAINEAPPSEMSEEKKQKSLQILDEITKQASSSNPVKPVLESLGKGLWEFVKNVASISGTLKVFWPILERLWK